MKTDHRIFIDWEKKSFLSEVADYLLDTFQKSGKLDLSQVILALPSQGGRRQLEKLLVKKVYQRIELKEIAPDWKPPKLLSIGTLPEQLYSCNRPLANDLTRQLAWRKVLEEWSQKETSELAPLLPLGLPDDEIARLDLAKLFSKLHYELASENCSFDDVLSLCRKKKESEQEVRRWELLCKIQERYHSILDELGFWDVQSARLYAIEHHECNTECEIFLIGTSDLNQLQKKILDELWSHVHFLVFAPESEKDLFDQYGTVLPRILKEKTLPLSDEQILEAEDPIEQGTLAVTWLQQKTASEETSADDPDTKRAAIGVADPTVTPFIELQLDQLDIPFFSITSASYKNNRLYSFLSLLYQFLSGQQYRAFSDLIRHPDAGRFLARKKETFGYLSAFDRYQNKYLPEKHCAELIKEDSYLKYNKCDNLLMQIVISQFDKILSPFLKMSSSEVTANVTKQVKIPDPDNEELTLEQIGNVFERMPVFLEEISNGEVHPLWEWIPLLSKMACQFYFEGTPENALKDLPRAIRENIKVGFEQFNLSLTELSHVPKSLQEPISGALALYLLLKEMEARFYSHIRMENSVDLVGWLQLLDSDTDHLLLTGMNEGLVPSFCSNDPVLPNSIREQLQIDNNTRRQAHDFHILLALCHSRPDLQVIFGHRSLAKDPLLPSRFFFFVDPDQIPSRVLRWFGEKEATRPLSQEESTSTRDPKTFGFRVPALKPQGPPPSAMSVTSFKDFIQSPYHYFLRYPLNLKCLSDDRKELNYLDYGSILHDVFFRFGQSPELKNETDPKTLFIALSSLLDAVVHDSFQLNNISALIPIQIAMMKKRLQSFAEWQCGWRQLGNEIVAVECAPESPVSIIVDDEPMQIRGRIDRIDYNSEKNIWYLFDYKTMDSYDKKIGKKSTSQNDESDELEKYYTRNEGNTPDSDHRKKIDDTNATRLLKKYLDCSPGRIWINLQLPLYRLLFRQLLKENPDWLKNGKIFNEDSLQFAYIILPKSDPVSALGAPWSESDLRQAEDMAKKVISNMRNLWSKGLDPEKDPDLLGTPKYDDFKAITMTDLFRTT